MTDPAFTGTHAPIANQPLAISAAGQHRCKVPLGADAGEEWDCPECGLHWVYVDADQVARRPARTRSPHRRKLTANMQAALERAQREDGIRRVHRTDKPGRPPWPAPAPTICALLRHGLLEHSRNRNRDGWWADIWKITDAGRLALDPPAGIRRARTRILQRDIWRGGDYTTAPSLSHPGLRSAGEAIDTGRLSPDWAETADGAHDEERDSNPPGHKPAHQRAA
jgi:hypothetical protein